MAEQEVREDIDPQLCKVYNVDKHKWEHAWIAEPKFDGLRCIIIVENGQAKPYSRNGKPLWNMDPILLEAAQACSKRKLEGIVLDGEVYTKDWNLSMSIVKRSTKTHPDQDKLHYHIWDCLTLQEWKDRKSTVSNDDRKKRLLALFPIPEKHIDLVVGKYVTNHEELQNVYLEFLEQGFEGAVLKDPTSIYELGKRSKYWLKVKPWTDADLTVTGYVEGLGKHEGRLGALIAEGTVEWNSKEFNVKVEVGTGFSDEEREFFRTLHNEGKLEGKIIEIVFQDVSINGSLRFPVYKRLRTDRE